MFRWLGWCAGGLCGLVFLLSSALANQAQDHSIQLDCFSQEALESLQRKSLKRPQLLYIWSPRMVFSAQHAVLAARAAQDLSIEFVPLIAPGLKKTEWTSALDAIQKQATEPIHRIRPSWASDYGQSARLLRPSRALCKGVLDNLDPQLHFPSAFLVQRGLIEPHAIRGAMPLEFWRNALQSRLSKQASTSPQSQAYAGVREQEPPSLANTAVQQASKQGEQQIRDTDNRVSESSVVNKVVEHDGSECVPQNEFIPLPESLAGKSKDAYGREQVAIGSYERISPDGRFVLRSYSGAKIGQVSLVELSEPPTKVIKVIPTPLSNEAFPVQGSWRYLVDVTGEHYVFKDIFSLSKSAKPRFKGGMSGFYAAAAELLDKEGRDDKRAPTIVQIRSLSWPNSTSDNADTQGAGNLMVRTIDVDTQNHSIVADSKAYQVCSERLHLDGKMYSLPMISVHGLEFAALAEKGASTQSGMKIFSFGQQGRGCELQEEFAFSTGKTIFGYAKALQPQADLAYEYQRQIWWYHRGSRQSFNIAPYTGTDSKEQGVLSAAFPGITRDGRIIYAATWQTCESPSQKICQETVGYIIADPWQSNAFQSFRLTLKDATAKDAYPRCILRSQVQSVRQEQAQFWGLPH